MTNLLTGDSQALRSSIGDWVAGTNTPTLSVGSLRFYSDSGSMLIEPVDTDPCSVLSPVVAVDESWSVGAPARCFCRVYCASASTVQASFTVVSPANPSGVTFTGESVAVRARSWTLVSVPGTLDAVETATIQMEVTFSDHEGERSFLTYPVITNTDLPALNLFAREAYFWLPEYMRDADASVSSPDFALYRFLDVLTMHLGMIYDQRASFRAVPPDEAAATDGLEEKTSDLVDPLTCPIDYLPWLASILGFTLVNPSSGLTSWANLEVTLADWLALQTDVDEITVDTFASPSPFTDLTRASNVTTATIGTHDIEAEDWINISGATPSSFNGDFRVTGVTATEVSWDNTGVDETASASGTLTFYDTDWSELETFSPTLTNLEVLLREQVAHAVFGLDAGSTRALKAIARIFLGGAQQVKVVSGYLGDPWAIKVYVVSTEVDTGASPAGMLERGAPAGFEVLYEAVDQATFDGI